MKQKFYQAYDELYEMYPEGYFLHRFASHDNFLFKRLTSELKEFYLKQEQLVESLKKEIEKFEFQHRFPFRPDAKYFLISNFNNMIVKPIIFQILRDDKEITEEQLKNYLLTDVQTIMSNALAYKKEEKISGHDVLKSIDSLWPQLQSTKMELWG